jgi:lipopolysaccharide export system protein LptA
MRGRRTEWLAAAALGIAACLAATAHAEKADRDKPVNIESDSMTADDAKKVATFDGKVVLTRGSLIIRGDRIVVRQDGDGFQYGIATGNPAKFRQKRDGREEYFEGEAVRIEYDGKTERVELFDSARLHRDGGDDVRGSYISYDSRTERFTVKSSGDANAGGGDGRVRAVIMPKNKEPAPAEAPRPEAAPAAAEPLKQ